LGRRASMIEHTTLFMDYMGGSMRADKVLMVMAAVVTTAGAALVASLATAPSADAQTPVVYHHAPTRVTVHKRSYLHPGTETKTYADHGSDYFYSPVHGLDPMQNSTLFNSGPGLPFVHDRMPLPNRLDLPGAGW
jgi:hypothetical protein